MLFRSLCEMLPPYLRFVHGIIDVEDLPLNVSREILQENSIMRSVKEQSVKKILGELAKLKEKDREKYIKFYKIFGKVIKEGLYGFSGEKEQILDLCLFKSSKREGLISLKEYKEASPCRQACSRCPSSCASPSAISTAPSTLRTGRPSPPTSRA